MTGGTLFVMGFGYSARHLVASLPPGWRIAATARSTEKADAMRCDGVAPVPWDDDGAVATALAAADHLLISVPPTSDGDPVLLRHGPALGTARHLAWAGYLSTTGVYGDRGGAWVNEESPLRPVNARSRWRAAAEAAWLDLAAPVHVFRLAGIYGPGRSALDRLRAGRAQRIVKPGQVFSRIHVADIAGTLIASMAAPRSGRIYNLADDEPAPPQDVIAFAAGIARLPLPPEVPFDAADLSPMARSFYAESKRVSNARIKDELGVTLRYPDYRAGLRAILKDGG